MIDALLFLVFTVLPIQREGILWFNQAEDGCSDSLYGFVEEIASDAPELVCVALPGYERMLNHSCICGAFQGAGYLAMTGREAVSTSLCWARVGERPETCQEVVSCGPVQSTVIFEDGFESGDLSKW